MESVFENMTPMEDEEKELVFDPEGEDEALQGVDLCIVHQPINFNLKWARMASI